MCGMQIARGTQAQRGQVVYRFVLSPAALREIKGMEDEKLMLHNGRKNKRE